MIWGKPSELNLWIIGFGTMFFSCGSIALLVLLLEHRFNYPLGYLVGMSAFFSVFGITLLILAHGSSKK